MFATAALFLALSSPASAANATWDACTGVDPAPLEYESPFCAETCAMAECDQVDASCFDACTAAETVTESLLTCIDSERAVASKMATLAHPNPEGVEEQCREEAEQSCGVDADKFLACTRYHECAHAWLEIENAGGNIMPEICRRPSSGRNTINPHDTKKESECTIEDMDYHPDFGCMERSSAPVHTASGQTVQQKADLEFTRRCQNIGWATDECMGGLGVSARDIVPMDETAKSVGFVNQPLVPPHLRD